MHAVVNKQCVDFTAGENIKNIYKVIGVWTMIGLKLKSNQFLLVVSAITQEDNYKDARMSTIPVKMRERWTLFPFLSFSWLN